MTKNLQIQQLFQIKVTSQSNHKYTVNRDENKIVNTHLISLKIKNKIINTKTRTKN